MKTIRTKILSLLLALVTILSLLPTSAFAASQTGSGIQITQNQAYWSTRLLANGTPYSYRPPLVDGKLVYCMDSGLGYHYATPSYLNSFTWTSGTGADADAVLQSAVTNSGLSEMDAATVENVKWMMTYLNDCKASNVGQLFMAVQTYVWENQSYKGEPGGDGDAGGYANADTYELYLSLIDSLLAKKAAEDAEFQRQIEEYKSQGIEATIVEDESARWAVYAISSNRKNQSFFNYYGPRKLVTGEPAPDQPEQPAGGTGKIVLKKTAGGTTTGLAGARFSIYFNGQIVGSDITNAQGEIYVEDATTGLWSFVETSAPDGYCVDPTPKSVYVDVTEGDREYGSAKWGSPKELNRKYMDRQHKDANIILTQRIRLGMDGYITQRNMNVLVVGGSGSGKTRFFCKPNIYSANCSYLITDPKGELLRAAGALLAAQGYEVRVFNLIDPSQSDGYNPFSYIGATNYSQKTIYLSDASATLHEFGHFLDWTLGIPAKHERLYLAEAQNSGLRDYAKNTSRTALTTGSHTAAAKNAWKPFGMPRHRPGPILRRWRKTTGAADIAYYFQSRVELRRSLCIRAAQQAINSSGVGTAPAHGISETIPAFLGCAMRMARLISLRTSSTLIPSRAAMTSMARRAAASCLAFVFIRFPS